jgi:hypothetical protein
VVVDQRECFPQGHDATNQTKQGRQKKKNPKEKKTPKNQKKEEKRWSSCWIPRRAKLW